MNSAEWIECFCAPFLLPFWLFFLGKKRVSKRDEEGEGNCGLERRVGWLDGWLVRDEYISNGGKLEGEGEGRKRVEQLDKISSPFLFFYLDYWPTSCCS